MIKVNRRKIKQFAKTAGDALERFFTGVETNMDSYGPQENDETFEEMVEESDRLDSHHCEIGYNTVLDPLGNGITSSNEITIFSDEAINENITSLNDEQRKMFDVVHKWSRDFIKIM